MVAGSPVGHQWITKSSVLSDWPAGLLRGIVPASLVMKAGIVVEGGRPEPVSSRTQVGEVGTSWVRQVTSGSKEQWLGPAGTGKSHMLVALGIAAVEAGHRVRYFTAADLVETLYRGLADNSVGKVIETLLRNELVLIDELGFAPLDDTGAQLLFRFVAAAYERRSLGIGSHWPFESWGRFLPEHTTAVSMLDRLLHHCHTVVTDGDSYRMKQAREQGGTRIKTN